jgi:hypothetical protein
VKLAFSQYRYVQRIPSHHHHEAVKNLTLEEYVASKISFEMDNSQTRAIAGDLGTPVGECTDEMLELAKRNLDEHFAWFGLTERFDESLILLQRAFGWRRVNYVSANVAPGKRPEPSARALELIAEHNRLDDELYRWVGERFDAAIAADSLFDETYDRFTRTNALYRPWGNLTYTLPQRVYGKLKERGVVSRKT